MSEKELSMFSVAVYWKYLYDNFMYGDSFTLDQSINDLLLENKLKITKEQRKLIIGLVQNNIDCPFKLAGIEL